MDIVAQMQKIVDSLKVELQSLRTGRATTALVENIEISVYGTQMRLMELATIQVVDVHTLTIHPWDMGNLSPIRKALEESNLGVHPVIDANNVIRITIPLLTEDRRKELVKRVKQIVEEYKVKVRLVRHDALKEIDKQEKEKVLSEDDAKRAREKIQKTTESFSAMLDDIGSAKEADLMKV